MVVDEAIEEEKDDDVDEEYTLQAISGKEQEMYVMLRCVY